MVWDGNERRDGSMSKEALNMFIDIKEKLAKIETANEYIKELITHHRKDVKEHIDLDNLNFKALGVAIAEQEDRMIAKNDLLLRIILPACGGATVILFFLNWFHK